MPRKTLTQRIAELDSIVAEAKFKAFHEGVEAARKEHSAQLSAAKLAQQQVAAKLMEEAGRIMSRAGYMIGKINGDNGR